MPGTSVIPKFKVGDDVYVYDVERKRLIARGLVSQVYVHHPGAYIKYRVNTFAINTGRNYWHEHEVLTLGEARTLTVARLEKEADRLDLRADELDPKNL